MDLNLRLIHARDFVKTTPEGELDLATSKRLLLTLASENAAPNQFDILIDIRRTTVRLTFMNITELVDLMIEHRESFRSKLALLNRPDAALEGAKFMELYAGNRGFQVSAFNDFEEAMNWLMISNDLIAAA